MMTKQTSYDGATIAGALTSPVWLDYAQNGGEALLLLGGVSLVWLRVVLAVREMRLKKAKKD
jgi:hypothetical protein